MSENATRGTLRDVEDRLRLLEGALDADAYSAAAEFAEEIASALRALNERLVRERIDAGLDDKP